MMALAGFSGKEVIKRFQRIGYIVVRIRGSHARLHHSNHTQHKFLTIPLHQEIKIGLLKQLLKDAGIDEQTFLLTFHNPLNILTF